MRAYAWEDKPEVRHLAGYFGEPDPSKAHADLIAGIFGVGTEAATLWRPFGLFDEGGACRAAAEARGLPLDVGGRLLEVGAIRRVGVDPAWRGRGLMRAVVGDALAWCAAEGLDLVLLFTETPALYRSLGFRRVPQHAFVGSAPAPRAAGPTPRALDPRRDEGRARLAEMLAQRQPVSAHGGLAGAPDLASEILAGADDLACLDLGEAIVVVDRATEAFTLVDVIARRIPSLAAILGAVTPTVDEVTVLFAPDRLDWAGSPRPESNGLMARGPLPPALRRPFMLPPTAEF